MTVSVVSLTIVTIIVSIVMGFSISLGIISKYIMDSNDFGNDFGEMFDVIQSSLKITERKDKIKGF